jgi:hypothetical protein
MKSTIRSVWLGTTAAIALGFSGCGENNEARLEPKGVTPPGAAETSDAGLKVDVPRSTTNPYNKGAGSGPKTAPVRKAVPAAGDSAAPAAGK